MQKSKKMMVSLCGLALSSLFIVGNKNVVHADTVNTNSSQDNAISWDSDLDIAQGVQNTQPMHSHAKTSTVQSVSEAPRTTNQIAAVQSPKISNINDAQAAVPVVINNPAGDKVHVHYIDSNGNAVDNSSHDYDIDVTKTGQGSYIAPTDSKGNKYQLNYPDGKYTVSGGAFNGTNLHATVTTVPGNPGRRVRHMGQWTDDNYDEDSANKTLPYVKNDRLYVYNKYLGKYVPVYTKDDTDKITATYAGDDDIGNTSGFGIGDANKWRLSIRNKNEVSESAIDDTTNLVWVYNDPIGHFEPSSIHKAPDTYETIGATSGYTNQTLPVAFVDSNNNIVGMIQNYTGKVGTTQNVSLTVPTGYELADGQSLPTSVTFANSTDPKLIHVVLNGQVSDINAPVNGTNIRYPINYTVHVKFVDQQTGQDVGGSYDIDVAHQGNESKINMGGEKVANGTQGVGIYLAPKFYPSVGTYNVPAGYATNNNQYEINIQRSLIFENEPNGQTDDLSFLTDDEYAKLMNGLAAFDDTVWPGYNTSKGAYAGFGQASSYHNFGPNSVVAHQVGIPDNEIVMAMTLRDGTKIVKPLPGLSQEEARDIYNRFMSHIDSNIFNYPELGTTISGRSIGIRDTGNIVNGNTVTVPVHKTNSFSFADNSGNVQSVSGNTVDVTLTKPQSVNPATDTRCQSQATRVIHVNFPDGQIPESYKGIVDSHGNLKQTVHFTRTATEDALTGNILQYGSWTSDNQDHNFIGFPERTLPKIPGYTLSIKPA